MSGFNNQRFERQVFDPNPSAFGNKNFSIAEAEKYLNDERVRGITVQEKLAKQVDDMLVKDLKGATLIRDLEAK